MQGNGGQLSYSYPLVVAPGPQGTVPDLRAVYSSGATNERRAPTTPANNVGDGWELALGSVSAEKYPDGSIWYSLSDVDNVSDRLIPDTSGTNFATQHLSYLKVTKITSGATGQPCFNVWGTEGTFYEFGCTSDSLQYYIDSTGNRVNYRFDLDRMIPTNEGPGTNGRNLTASYVQDMETSGGHTWVRDAALKQITYGNGINRIGTVDFFYNGPTTYSDPTSHIQYVTQYTSTYETNCHLPATGQTPQRCDDPLDRSGGMADPDVMSTFSLQTVKTYVGDNSSTSHLDYSYAFAYQETAFGNCPSADSTLSTAYCAGNHLLSSITPTVYQNGAGSALPGVTFGYSGARTNKYDDSSQSYHMENSWNYLTSYHDHSNGVGATSITYHTAYNNSHGTPNTAGDNRYDTLYCAYNPTNCNSGTAFYPMDDKMWTMQVVTIITATGKDSSASSLSPASTTYDYWLTQTQGSCPADSAMPPNSDCVGFGWIPNSGKDWQSYYHGIFTGFGTVLDISPAGDLTVQHYASTWGWDSSSADPRNYLAGKMVDEEVYQGQYINDANLLTKTANSYGGQNSTKAACASTSTYPSTLYQPCETVLLSSRTTTYEKTGSGNTNAPWVQKDYTYDDYTTGGGLGDYHQAPATGSYHNLQQVVTSGSNIPSRTQHFTYYTTNTSSGGTTYYNVHSIAHIDLVDATSHMWKCEDATYDAGVAGGVPTPSAGWPTTDTGYTNCASQGTTAFKTYSGYDKYGNKVASVDAFGAANPSAYGSTGCTLTTAPQFFPTSAWSASRYTDCSAYDPTSSLPTDSWNVLGQHESTAYDGTQGLLPITQTDANSLVTNILYSYDGSGNKTAQMKLPNEAGSYTSQATVTSLCTDSSTLPCVEVDSNTVLYSGVKSRSFYDSLGREVETQTPGPDGAHTTVSFTVYNDQTHSVFSSLPFIVNSRTTWLDPNGATDDTGAAPGGTSVVLDPLDRTISTTDALSNQSNASYGLGSVSGDSNTYATTKVADANKHVQIGYTDALDEMRYMQENSGLSTGTLTTNTQKAYQYNALEKPTSLVVTDLAPQSVQTITSVTTQMQYNDVGEVTTLIDPDRGTLTYTYDADGRSLTEVSGTRTIGTSYDLLGRDRCIQDAAPTTDGSGACSSGSHPLVQNTYDTTTLGTAGTTDFSIGDLTQSIATTYYDPNNYSNKATVTQQFQHDQRGRGVASNLQIGVPSSWNVTTTLPTYMQTQSYNDASQPTTTQTTVGGAAGYVFSQAYDSTTGTLTGLSNNATAVANLATQGYNAQGLVSDINFQTTTATALATDHFGFDGNLRPVSAAATWQSGSGSTGSIFSDTQSYDAVGNVTSKSVTHAAVPGQAGSGGSQTENFCYDEQNRMVWAGNSGTQPAAGNGTCGSGTLSNSLGGASYSSSFAYTHLGQLWQGPVNGSGATQQYLYCDSSHPHQLKGLYPTGNACTNPTGATYSSQYDAWGNVTSRTYNSTTATLSYDILDHLTQWNAGSSSQEWYAYDAGGNRVIRRSTTGSGTSITTYAFGLEEHSYDATGNSTNNTYYYTLDGRLIGELTGTGTPATQFFLTDTLGSVLATLNATAGSASLQGNQLYGPYGNSLYKQGSLGTSKGYTGQYNDATGLDYYNARYYDPIVGVFLSADDVQGNVQGMNPYAYVAGNPETDTDPTGLQYIVGRGAGGGLGNFGGGIGGDGIGQIIAAILIAAGWSHPSPNPGYHPTSSSWTPSSGGSITLPHPINSVGWNTYRLSHPITKKVGGGGTRTGGGSTPWTKPLTHPKVQPLPRFHTQSSSGGTNPRKLTIPANVASHMFGSRAGHIIDTPENRQLLIDTASDSKNLYGVDTHGNEGYAKELADGRQIWVNVRGNNITNGGINDTPRQWDPQTGFSRPFRPRGNVK